MLSMALLPSTKPSLLRASVRLRGSTNVIGDVEGILLSLALTVKAYLGCEVCRREMALAGTTRSSEISIKNTCSLTVLSDHTYETTDETTARRQHGNREREQELRWSSNSQVKHFVVYTPVLTCCSVTGPHPPCFPATRPAKATRT